ncbi:hypothetical protein J2N86_15090 (plasmid) [Legionella lytica]|uniref:Uncharacterized protein n=1 Tax=Legionella lytica TaxID=96232 RepID=A0ABY4YCB8_9GAMM|nr:hypothetical protein [Legionella lytica]USQ15285.1 hypothetical protein J2N86_15090 [Legionella lytica]
MAGFFGGNDNKLSNLATKENMMVVGGIIAACSLAAISMTAFFVALAVTISFFGYQAMQDQKGPSFSFGN